MIVTISSGLGVGESEFAEALGARLELPVLSREAIRATVLQESLREETEETDETLPAGGVMGGLVRRDRRYGEVLAQKILALIGEQSLIAVGWGTTDILRRHCAFHIRLVARREERVNRLALRLDTAPETAARLLQESDQHRAEFHRRLFDTDPTDVRRYHLTLNLSLQDVAPAVDLAQRCVAAAGLAPTPEPHTVRAWRCLTISRQFGAGGRELAELLSQDLGWPLYDRELLQRSAALRDIPLPELLRIDERGPEFLERVRLMQASARYFEGLRDAIEEAAAGAKTILVGRGSRHLVPPEGALHLRLVADDADRIERVMRRRWLAASAAEELMREEDRCRADFHRHFFRLDAADPRLSHVTCCSSRLPLPVIAAALSGFLSSTCGPEARTP